MNNNNRSKPLRFTKQKRNESIICMKKTERQIGIVHLLRILRKMNANELASYFEVSERTIYRDIDALSQLRVPIVAYEGLGVGYVDTL